MSLSENIDATESRSVFDFNTKTVMLNSGYEMPIYGIGTYSLLDEVFVNFVITKLYPNQFSDPEAAGLVSAWRQEI